MSDCFCFRKYQCLACEKKANESVLAIHKPNRKKAECGTRAGYARHLKLGEATCSECKAAQTLAVIAYKQSKQKKESA
jgi:hypothetical protein